VTIEEKTPFVSCGLSETEGQAGAAHMIFRDLLAVFIACDLFGLVAQTFGR
jgi:hypothetical protein